jgi:NADPH:quinone reductase-like Zn-dependent oxidoreductase
MARKKDRKRKAMKVAIWTAYGPPNVLQPREVPTPAPGDGEFLVRVRTTTVTMGDCELRGIQSLSPFVLAMRLYLGLLRPKRICILGQELAGDVAAVGRDVTEFKEGDRVFAATGFRLRAHAQYTCLPQEGTVALMPPNVSYEEAAIVPPAGATSRPIPVRRNNCAACGR